MKRAFSSLSFVLWLYEVLLKKKTPKYCLNYQLCKQKKCSTEKLGKLDLALFISDRQNCNSEFCKHYWLIINNLVFCGRHIVHNLCLEIVEECYWREYWIMPEKCSVPAHRDMHYDLQKYLSRLKSVATHEMLWVGHFFSYPSVLGSRFCESDEQHTLGALRCGQTKRELAVAS